MSRKRSHGTSAPSSAGSDAVSLLGSVKDEAPEGWGTDSFKGCRMCRRLRTTPNPFDVPGKPLLAFKSDRHSLCLPCIGVCRKKDPQILTDKDKRSAYLKKLAEDDEAFQSHRSDLESYEKGVQESMAKRRKLGQLLPEDPEIEQPNIVVNQNQEGGLEMRRLLGVLWPVDLFEKYENRKPNPTEITKITQGSATLVGVMRSRDMGMPAGTTEIFDIQRSTACKVTTLGSSDKEAFQDEVKNQWDQLQRGHRLTSSASDDGAVALSFENKRKKGADEFDDLFAFDAVTVTVGEEEDTKNVTGGQGKNSNKGGKGRRTSGASKETKVKELQAAEKVVLDGVHMLQNMKDEGITTVKTKLVSSLVDKVAGKLTPTLVKLYTSGYEEDCPGMVVLEKLRTLQRMLNIGKDFAALAQNPEASGFAIQQKAQELQDASSGEVTFQVSPKLLEMCLQREVDQKAKAKDWTGVLDVILSTGAGLNACIISNELSRATFQEREVTRLAASLLREDGKVAEMKVFVDAVLASDMKGGITQELQLLQPMLKPMDRAVPVELLGANIEKFKGDKSLKLAKMVNNFSTGIAILEEAAAAIEQRAKDTSLTSRVAKLATTAAELCVADTSPDGDFMSCAEAAEKFDAMATEYGEITTSGSLHFLEQHKDELSAVKNKLQELIAHGDALADKKRQDMVQEYAGAIVDAFNKTDDEVVTSCKKTCDNAVETILDWKIERFGNLLTEEEKLSRSTEMKPSLDFLHALQSSIADLVWAEPVEFDYKKQPLVDFANMLPAESSTPTLLLNTPSFKQVICAAGSKVEMMLEKFLDNCFKPFLANDRFVSLLHFCVAFGGSDISDVNFLGVCHENLDMDALKTAAEQCKGMLGALVKWLGHPLRVPGLTVTDDLDGEELIELANDDATDTAATANLPDENTQDLPDEDTLMAAVAAENLPGDNTQNLPDENAQNLSDENTQDLPDEDTLMAAIAAENLPGDNTQNLPDENAQNLPDENTQDLPDEDTLMAAIAAENLPGDNTQNLPDENAQNLPNEITQKLPDEGTPMATTAAENLPGDSTQNFPGENAQNLPDENTQKLPDEDTPMAAAAAENLPGDSTQNFPGENAQMPDENTQKLPDDDTRVAAAAAENLPCDSTQNFPGENAQNLPHENTQKLPDEDTPMAADESPMAVDAAAQKGAQTSVRAPLWIQCLFPVFGHVSARIQTLQHIGEKITFQDIAAVAHADFTETCQAFVDDALSLHTIVNEFRAGLQQLELTDEGQKVLFGAAACKHLEFRMKMNVEGIVIETCKAIQKVEAEATATLESDTMQFVATAFGEGCDDKVLQKVLPISQSKESKTLHQCAKNFTLLDQIVPMFQSLKRSEFNQDPHSDF
ncbi:xynB [Symbiodinium sp. CCMP2592]|nr:xynB [Symbiodinium sp. CCMP2592]